MVLIPGLRFRRWRMALAGGALILASPSPITKMPAEATPLTVQVAAISQHTLVAAEVPALAPAAGQEIPTAAAAGVPNLPLDRSLGTCWAEFQLNTEANGFDYRLGPESYAPCVTTFEASIQQAWQSPGVIPDGYLNLAESQHAAFLNGLCFGEAVPALHWRLFGAMAGEISCPTGASVTTHKVHIDRPASHPIELNKRAIVLVFGPLGRAGEALGVSFCEARWQNVDGDYYAGLFQEDPGYVAAGNIYWQWGLGLSDRDDPYYNSAAARAKVEYLGGWGTGEWPNCHP